MLCITSAQSNGVSPLAALRRVGAIEPRFSAKESLSAYSHLPVTKQVVEDLVVEAGMILHRGRYDRSVAIGDVLLATAFLTLSQPDERNKEVNYDIFQRFMEVVDLADGIRWKDELSAVKGEGFQVLQQELIFAGIIARDSILECNDIGEWQSKFFSEEYLFSGSYLTSNAVETMIKAAAFGFIPQDLTMAILNELVPELNVLGKNS